MSVAIIPARGGSKGIRRKNVIPLCGKPLIAWTIEQAKVCDRVIVATDNSEIADVSLQYGAEVFHRSTKSATDDAPSEEVLIEVLDGIRPLAFGEPVVFLQATSPIRQPDDIESALETLVVYNCDSVFSARYVEGYTWRQIGKTVSREYMRRPRQHEPVHTLEENGSIYVFRHEVFRREGDRICGKTKPYIMHALDSFQVDEHGDIELLETLIRLRLPDACTLAEA